MRDYGKVYTAFWTSEDSRGFSEDGRMLALYLMTCTHGNMIGCFRLPNAYAAEDLKWDADRVSKGFDELYRKGYAYRCSTSFWVVILRHLKWNKLENPNVGKAAAKLFDAISPPDSVRMLLVKALKEFSQFFPSEKLEAFDTLSIPLDGHIETLSKPVAVTVAVTVAPTVTVDIATALRLSPLEKKEPKQKSENITASTWEAYSNAYFDRYGTEPVRNAKVNAGIAQFVQRLGKDEAPHVARFFVGHGNGYYVREMHAVGPMLKDAEKLRTEWATNSRMTAHKAMQSDRTQTNFDSFGPLIAAAQSREEIEKQQGGCHVE